MRIPTNLVFVIISILIVLAACNSGKKNVQTILREDNLKIYSAEIDNSRDTVLQAPGGSLLTVPAGSFDGGNGTKIRLLIKEALTIPDIIMAGLTTESNGKQLSSGGMIDIEAADGQNLHIIKPIRISVPGSFIDSKMMVFKGVKGDDGQINWTNPVPMASTSQMATLHQGEQLFKQKCASCHGIQSPVTGPSLAFISRLRPENWLFNYTRNNAAIMKSGDPYANCLFEQYNKTPMPAFPELSVSDLNRLYAYIDNESKKSGLPIPDDHIKKCVDSCLAYQTLKDSLTTVRNRLIDANGSGISYSKKLPGGYVSADTTGPSKRSPQVYPAVYYQFQVTSFGWYNIDRFLQEMDGVKNSRMVVRVEGQYRGQVSVFLIVPQAKVFEQGGPLENKVDEWGFFGEQGELPLLQSVTASLIVVGEQQGQLVFDLTSFTTRVDQTLTLQPIPVAKEAMNERISRLRLDSFNMDMKESKNAKAIKSIDDKLESTKPKTCDCHCGFRRPPVESDSLALAGDK